MASQYNWLLRNMIQFEAFSETYLVTLLVTSVLAWLFISWYERLRRARACRDRARVPAPVDSTTDHQIHPRIHRSDQIVEEDARIPNLRQQTISVTREKNYQLETSGYVTGIISVGLPNRESADSTAAIVTGINYGNSLSLDKPVHDISGLVERREPTVHSSDWSNS